MILCYYNTFIVLCVLLVANLNAIKDLVAESSVMKQFNHPNVLSLLGVCVDPNDDDVFKVVLPFMANGDLRSFLKCNRVEPNKIDEYNDVISMHVTFAMYLCTFVSSQSIDEHTLLHMCLDIAKGMKYLVDKRFIHRDLAARNCMYGLCDGFSTVIYKSHHNSLYYTHMAVWVILNCVHT